MEEREASSDETTPSDARCQGLRRLSLASFSDRLFPESSGITKPGEVVTMFPTQTKAVSRRAFGVFALVLFSCSSSGGLGVARAGAAPAPPTADKPVAAKPALQKLVDEGKIAGAVVLVERRGSAPELSVVGYRDLATKTLMTEDTIFAIMSMTKPITCVGAMMLVEQGKLGLDDPVAKYLPEFKDIRVLGDAKDDTATEIATVPAKRMMTVRHLLAHSAGFTYGGLLGNTRLDKAYQAAGVQDPSVKTLAEQVARLAKVPLAHEPGEGWNYGLNHDVLGRVVEVVSGQSLDKYLQEKLLGPLGMNDTSYLVPEAKRDRVATIYSAAGGTLAPLPKNFGSETFFPGGAGLFSTARDYARFCKMLLGRGTLDGARILKPETLALMTTNQIGDIQAKIGDIEIGKYGLGFGVTIAPGSNGGPPVLDSYGWAGYYSTFFRIVPPRETIGVMMTQVVPTNYAKTNEILLGAVE
jgi:CubicO group peptidase (beta-lactamase class C family)